MASVWKGSLSFGLVNIPVSLHPAIRTGTSGGELHFRQLHREDLAPIKYERVCSADGEPVPWGDIVKGYEYSKGKYIALTDEDMKAAAAAVESSRALEMIDFVPEADIDPRYFETPYYLLPDKGGEKAYALLRDAIHKTGMIGIGKFTLRQKQQLASVKAVDKALVLELMRFVDELVDPADFTFPTTEVRPQELAMAEQLIGNLASDFDPTRYTDDYRQNLMRIIKAKLKGKKIVAEPVAEPEGTKVLDLMARLQESLAQGKNAKKEGRRGAERRDEDTEETERSESRERTRRPAARKARRSA